MPDPQVTLYDEDGEPVAIPSKFYYRIVCPRCDGTGKHVNPSIDGNGISTSDEIWADDDFREGYFGGRYDITCMDCEGANVISCVDEDALKEELPELHAMWFKAVQDRYEDEQIARMERMMGA